MGILSDITGGIGDLIGGVGDAIGGAFQGITNNPELLLASLAIPGVGEFAGLGGMGIGGGAEAGLGDFLGEGVASGVGGWDAAAASSALGSGEFGTALSYLAQNPSLIFGGGSLFGGKGGGLGRLAGLGGKGGGAFGGVLDAAQGLYGLSLAQKMRKGMDPFAGARAGYANRLGDLERNPAAITGLPGYQAGLDAVARRSAAGGYAGSGNELAALSQYGGQFYGNELNRLATLAGGGAAPGAGMLGAAGLTSGSLKTLGTGARGLFDLFGG